MYGIILLSVRVDKAMAGDDDKAVENFRGVGTPVAEARCSIEWRAGFGVA